MGIPLALALCLASLLHPQVPAPEEEPDAREAWELSVAERMSSVPNPYEFHEEPSPVAPPQADDPWMAQHPPSQERRFFEMEDSADWLGLPLGSRATAGLQVEFVGPAEEPKRERRMTNLQYDPFNPVYVQTTVGFRIRF